MSTPLSRRDADLFIAGLLRLYTPSVHSSRLLLKEVELESDDVAVLVVKTEHADDPLRVFVFDGVERDGKHVFPDLVARADPRNAAIYVERTYVFITDVPEPV